MQKEENLGNVTVPARGVPAACGLAHHQDGGNGYAGGGRLLPAGAQSGGVVLCIVLFSTPVETYVAYSLNRIFDTAVGVIVALLVNYFLPRERVVAFWEKFKGLFRPVEHT